MKKIICLSILFLFGFFYVKSQTSKFGVHAGYLNGHVRVIENNGSASTSDSGYFLGAFSQFELSDKIALTPQVDIGSINNNGFGFLSVLFGYYILNDFKVEAGPQVSYFLETTPEDVNSLGLDIGFGMSYDITDKFIISARYNAELSNRASNVDSEDIKARYNWLLIGLGYSF
ncbi:OmpW family protein [Flagellimonas onchidii]|uniref:OmpW family protein n=1 Tax=Flagellimonas onchidii TaxID=2562684 RepID=UPI0010A6A0E9|nr:OmpW family protein [Allomuricauda onchidii]